MVSHHARGTETELTADSVEIASILAQVSSRGRDWQQSTIWLYEFGFVPSESALRETAIWLVAKADGALRRAARSVAELPSADDVDAVEAFLERVARCRSSRPLRRSLREAIRARHPHLSQRELRERADSAEFWSTFFQLFPSASRDPDLMAVADGFRDAQEARAFGWSPRNRPSIARIRRIAPTVTRPEMEALALCYDRLVDVPGFEHLERGASRFEHALADISSLRKQFSRSLKSPVSQDRIFESLLIEDASVQPELSSQLGIQA